MRGHVTEVTGRRHARENIENDEVVGPERAGAAVVRIAGLVAAGDDGVEGRAALAEDGALDGEAEDLRRERPAGIAKRAALRPRGAEDGLGGGEADGAEAVALADGGGLGVGLDLAIGKHRAVGRLEFHAEGAQFQEEGDGKVIGDAEAADVVGARELGDDLGRADLAAGPTRGGAGVPVGEGQDGVEGAGLLDPPEFEGVLERDALFADPEGDEGVMHADAAEVELIGAGAGVGVEQGRKSGSGHEEREVELRGGED